MKRKVKTHARAYYRILAQIFMAQGIGGKVVTATRGARHLSLGVRLNDPRNVDKAIKLTEPIALASRVDNLLAQRVKGVIAYQFQLQSDFWQAYTWGEDISGLGVGLAEQRRPVTFSFDDAPHALFAGTSGSGKTTAIMTALIALLSHYTPDELQLVLVDQKNELSEFENEAHLVLPRAITNDEATTLLAWADNELQKRIQSGQDDHPRLLVVIDEASMLPVDGKNNPTLAALQNLAKLGRSYNVNLIIGDQKPSQTDLPKVTDNALNRFVGLVSDAGTSARLTGHSGLDAHKLTGKGDFLHVVGANVTRFQVAMARKSDFDGLERLHTPPKPAIEVKLPVDVELPRRGGHKPLMIEPAPLAVYMHHNELSIRQGKELLGFSKSRHNFYKAFLADLKRFYNLPESKLLALARGE